MHECLPTTTHVSVNFGISALLAVVILVGIVLSVLIYSVKKCSSSRLSRIKYTLHLIITLFILEEKDSNCNSPESEVNVEMQRCSVYEVV